jgi:hypothetical protein
MYLAFDKGATPAITPKLRTKLQDFRAQMPVTRSLIQLRTDAPIDLAPLFVERVPADVATFGEDDGVPVLFSDKVLNRPDYEGSTMTMDEADAMIADLMPDAPVAPKAEVAPLIPKSEQAVTVPGLEATMAKNRTEQERKTANLDIWDRVKYTEPRFVKPITGKQYKGNSPAPYYIVRRLTEEFGPCGDGWGMKILSERFERLTSDDMLHVAHVKLWYMRNGVIGEIEQMGQTKATYKTSDGSKMMVDEDAPKKSVTDALVKAASYLGFAGDIFSGRWDDSKYVEWLTNEKFGKAK